MRKLLLILLLVFCFQYPMISKADECMEGDCENGIGTGFTEDEKVYSGEWQNGMPHGLGTLIVSKGKKVEGRWEKGVLVESKKNE